MQAIARLYVTAEPAGSFSDDTMSQWQDDTHDTGVRWPAIPEIMAKSGCHVRNPG
jgi:hypothetical protein